MKSLKMILKPLAGKSLVFLLVCGLGSLILFTGCGKDKPVTPGTGSKFKPADFKISNIVTEQLSYALSVDYEEMNTTAMNYNYDTDGAFRIKWTVKTTDGVQYQEDRLLATELDAGAAAALSCDIEITEGKTVDLSTLKYEVYFDH